MFRGTTLFFAFLCAPFAIAEVAHNTKTIELQGEALALPDRLDQCANANGTNFQRSIEKMVQMAIPARHSNLSNYVLKKYHATEGSTPVGLGSHDLCELNADSLAKLLRDPSKVPNAETIEKMNAFAKVVNQARAAKDNAKLTQLWSKMFQCVANAESGIADAFAKENSEKTESLKDYIEKKSGTSIVRHPGVHFYEEANRVTMGTFQFSLGERGEEEIGNVESCVSAWNEQFATCQIPDKNPKTLFPVLISKGQAFNIFCGTQKILDTFYIQANSNFVNDTNKSSSHPSNKGKPGADRCVTPHVFANNSYNHFGTLMNSTKSNLGELMSCVSRETAKIPASVNASDADAPIAPLKAIPVVDEKPLNEVRAYVRMLNEENSSTSHVVVASESTNTTSIQSSNAIDCVQAPRNIFARFFRAVGRLFTFGKDKPDCPEGTPASTSGSVEHTSVSTSTMTPSVAPPVAIPVVPHESHSTSSQSRAYVYTLPTTPVVKSLPSPMLQPSQPASTNPFKEPVYTPRKSILLAKDVERDKSIAVSVVSSIYREGGNGSCKVGSPGTKSEFQGVACCYNGTKQVLKALGMVKGEMNGVAADSSPKDLILNGFVYTSSYTPANAPDYSVIVYDCDGSGDVPCSARNGSEQALRTCGHIELKLGGSFFSDHMRNGNGLYPGCDAKVYVKK